VSARSVSATRRICALRSRKATTDGPATLAHIDFVLRCTPVEQHQRGRVG
jgi:hypothetical protein